MSTLLVACFLSTLLAPAFSGTCLTCTVKEGTCTENTTRSCDFTTHACATVSTDSYGSSSDTSRTCIEKSQCDKSATYVSNTSAVRLSTTCCNEDNCTSTIPTLPPITNFERNGKSCPYCITSYNLNCTAYADMLCTGDFNECFEMSVQYKDLGTFPEFETFSGCSSKSMCDFANVFINPIYGKNVTVICNTGTSLQLFTVLIILALAVSSVI
ncbi:Hypothetical predicted protein [Pelobates cultripes]|uniref:Sodefrin-like factor n=1 Tax=Pelobates cultripes TaxID=61616 RepID=A0AAD1TPA5_PELCU|nr:Hypothetical predicted protein [Pelobates cultripes]